MTDAPKQYRYRHNVTATYNEDEKYYNYRTHDGGFLGRPKDDFERDYEPVEPQSIIGKSFTVRNDSSSVVSVQPYFNGVHITDAKPVEKDGWVFCDDRLPLHGVTVEIDGGFGCQMSKIWYSVTDEGCHLQQCNRILGNVIRWKPKLKEEPVEQAAQGWRDISLAPKDGELIDLWIPELGERYTDCSYCVEEGAFYCDFHEANKRVYFTATPPSHFMPLPKPPAREE